jgi:hypothetical protein
MVFGRNEPIVTSAQSADTTFESSSLTSSQPLALNSRS